VRKLYKRTCIAAAVIALGGLVACQTSQPSQNPGALPVSKLDVSPRLNASTYVAHGHLLEQQGNLAQAVEQYRHALALTPDLLAARNRLGVTLNKLGLHAEASHEFGQALARHPQSGQLRNNLGFSLYLEGRYEEAEQELARAVDLQPSFRRAQMNHGLALAKLGRYDEALAAFTVASSEADAYYNLAVVQTDAKHYAEAARALEHALVLNPDFTEARQQLRDVSRLAAAEETKRAEAERDAAIAAEQAERVAAVAAEEAERVAAVAAGAEEAERLAAAAAAEEAARVAAVAAEEARAEETQALAAAETPAAIEPPAPAEPEAALASITLGEPTPEPVADVVLAGSFEAAVPTVNSALAIFQQVQTATNARMAAMPPSQLPAINADRLTALFAELVTAMKSDTPWYDDPQRRIEQLMGVLDQSK
jgi:Flp pilus assembly protein TadD